MHITHARRNTANTTYFFLQFYWIFIFRKSILCYFLLIQFSEFLALNLFARSFNASFRLKSKHKICSCLYFQPKKAYSMCFFLNNLFTVAKLCFLAGVFDDEPLFSLHDKYELTNRICLYSIYLLNIWCLVWYAWFAVCIVFLRNYAWQSHSISLQSQ